MSDAAASKQPQESEDLLALIEAIDEILTGPNEELRHELRKLMTLALLQGSKSSMCGPLNSILIRMNAIENRLRDLEGNRLYGNTTTVYGGVGQGIGTGGYGLSGQGGAGNITYKTNAAPAPTTPHTFNPQFPSSVSGGIIQQTDFKVENDEKRTLIDYIKSLMHKV